MVGTYYSSPSPDSPAFCGTGDIVRKGQTLCLLKYPYENKRYKVFLEKNQSKTKLN